MNSKLATFLKIASVFGPQILAFTPLAPIAMPVAAAIREAEAMGGSGEQKLAHVTNIAMQAANAVNAQAGHTVLDTAIVSKASDAVISAVVDSINLVHSVHSQDPAPAAAPTTQNAADTPGSSSQG